MLQIFTRSYELPEISQKEVLRYAGIRGTTEPDSELLRRFDEAVSIATVALIPRVCFCELDVKACDFGSSLDIRKNLRDSESVILFASTVGLELDRLITRYEVTSPATALLLDAIGSERIETLCDAFCEDMRAEKSVLGMSLRPRFSAGYGDLSIEYQKTLFALLDPPSRIGLTLNDSYLMSPSKSVTAIIGVEKIKEF